MHLQTQTISRPGFFKHFAVMVMDHFHNQYKSFHGALKNILLLSKENRLILRTYIEKLLLLVGSMGEMAQLLFPI